MPHSTLAALPRRCCVEHLSTQLPDRSTLHLLHEHFTFIRLAKPSSFARVSCLRFCSSCHNILARPQHSSGACQPCSPHCRCIPSLVAITITQLFVYCVVLHSCALFSFIAPCFNARLGHEFDPSCFAVGFIFVIPSLLPIWDLGFGLHGFEKETATCASALPQVLLCLSTPNLHVSIPRIAPLRKASHQQLLFPAIPASFLCCIYSTIELRLLCLLYYFIRQQHCQLRELPC